MPGSSHSRLTLLPGNSITAIASRSLAVGIVNGRPPFRPLARAEARPATVRSEMSSRTNSAGAAKVPTTSLAAAVVVSTASTTSVSPSSGGSLGNASTATDGGPAWLPDRPAAAAALLLHRRALHGTERAEYAAVPRIGAQQGLAVAALVKELAGIRGHGFLSGKTTVRTGQHGFQDDRIHRGLTSAQSRDSPHSWSPWSERRAGPCRGHR